MKANGAIFAALQSCEIKDNNIEELTRYTMSGVPGWATIKLGDLDLCHLAYLMSMSGDCATTLLSEASRVEFYRILNEAKGNVRRLTAQNRPMRTIAEGVWNTTG